MTLLFELIKIVIGRRNCLSITPSTPLWQKVIDLASEHGVLGFCFDAVE